MFQACFDAAQDDSRAVIVDVRSEDAKNTDGILELKRVLRSKGFDVPLAPLDSSIARRVRSARELELLTSAAIIKGMF